MSDVRGGGSTHLVIHDSKGTGGRVMIAHRSCGSPVDATSVCSLNVFPLVRENILTHVLQRAGIANCHLCLCCLHYNNRPSRATLHFLCSTRIKCIASTEERANILGYHLKDPPTDPDDRLASNGLVEPGHIAIFAHTNCSLNYRPAQPIVSAGVNLLAVNEADVELITLPLLDS